MFNNNQYEQLVFNPPVSGMNQNISDEKLPPNFCYYLENILPDPLGEGRVRYGTELVFSQDIFNYSLVKAFPFQLPDGGKQIIRYGAIFNPYTTATSQVIIDAYNFQVTSPNPPPFEEGTYIELQYTTASGTSPLTRYLIESITLVGGNTVNIEVTGNYFPVDNGIPVLTVINYGSGILDVYDFESNSILGGQNKVITGLSLACQPRGEYIAGKYWVCNGVDNIMTWDGTTLEVYEEYVKEVTNTLAYINATRVTFTSTSIFNINNYPVGGGIKFTNISATNAFTFETTVASISVNGSVITLNTVDNIPAFGANPRISLFFSAKPPAFSYLKAIGNRLFALGAGAVGLNYRPAPENLKFYYTATTSTDFDNGFKFFLESEQAVPDQDISGTHGGADNLEAIVVVSGKIAFMGRQRTQIWLIGDDVTATNYLQFSLLREVGVVHGDLIVDLPDDVYFISQNGMLSFSTLNTLSQQVATSSHNPVDPLIRQYIKTIQGSDTAYRACRAFKYSSGSFAGFKIGFNDLIVAMFNTKVYALGIFTGSFTQSGDYLSTLDDTLYLAIGDTIYRYGDGKYNPPVYGDNGDTDLVNFVITWVRKSTVGWANKRYVINASYPSSMNINPVNSLFISISGDTRKSYTIQQQAQYVLRGDALNTIPLAPDTSPQTIGFRLDIPYVFLNDRFKFPATKFNLTISGRAMDGPLSFKEVRLYGAKER